MANSQLILFWKWINVTSNSPILLWLHLPISSHMSSPGEMWSSRSSTWPIAGRENTISITFHISKHFSLSPSVSSYTLPSGESKTQVLVFPFPSYSISTSTTCTVAVFHDDVNLQLLQWPTVNIVLKTRYNKVISSFVIITFPWCQLIHLLLTLLLVLLLSYTLYGYQS